MANTGPIMLQSLDPTDVAAGWRDEVLVGDEAITAIREVGDGRLMIPGADLDDDGSPDHYVVGAHGAWTHAASLPGSPIHVTGFLRLPSGDWFLSGSAIVSGTQDGVVWRATDEGATWSIVLDVPPLSGATPPDTDTRILTLVPDGSSWMALVAASGLTTDDPRVFRWNPATNAVDVLDPIVGYSAPHVAEAVIGVRNGNTGAWLLHGGPTGLLGVDTGVLYFLSITDGSPDGVAGVTGVAAITPDGAGGVYAVHTSRRRLFRYTADGANLVIGDLPPGSNPVSVARNPATGHLAVGCTNGHVYLVMP